MGTPPSRPPQNPGPYPPPRGGRDAARDARDYARMQRDQARAQRQYWRAYWRGGRPSVLGPLVLLAIGVLALLVEVGRLDPGAIWSWFWRWWPVLLIGFGVVSLAEYFFDRHDPYARRRGGAGWLVVIVLLLVAGWGFHRAGWFAPDSSLNGSGFWYILGAEHDNDVRMDQAVAANAAVMVQNPRGDVTVTPSTDGQIHLSAHERVHASSDQDARKAFEAVHPKIETGSGNVTVSVAAHRGSAVDLTLAVPETSAVTVNAGRGDVSVEGMKSNVAVTSGRGDVKFVGITGDVHARMDGGDSDFSAHAIQGRVLLKGRAEDVTLSEIQGQTTLDGEFFGDMHLEQMGGAVEFRSSRTTLDIAGLGGDLTIDSGDLSASDLQGPVRIVTRSKNIELTSVAGDLHIENSDGDVNVTAASPLGNIDIANRTGNVTLTVPENAGFTVTATTTHDNDLTTDFPLQVTTSDDRKQLSGTVGGGGPQIHLSARHGDLRLRKGSTQTLPSAPPPPPSPSGPVRHLHQPKVPVAPVAQ